MRFYSVTGGQYVNPLGFFFVNGYFSEGRKFIFGGYFEIEALQSSLTHTFTVTPQEKAKGGSVWVCFAGSQCVSKQRIIVNVF